MSRIHFDFGGRGVSVPLGRAGGGGPGDDAAAAGRRAARGLGGAHGVQRAPRRRRRVPREGKSKDLKT